MIAKHSGGQETIWSRKVAAVKGDWQWHEARIDLHSLANKPIELVLRTRAQKGHSHPVWGNPVIVVPPAGNGPRNVILVAVATQVRAFDVMPTLLELVGIPVPQDLDAKSLLPLLSTGAADAHDCVSVPS